MPSRDVGRRAFLAAAGGVMAHTSPVMVWFPRGGYRSGSANSVFYDGLEAIGGSRYASSANVGLLDLVAALQWVRGNIAAFGGDPGSVTATAITTTFATLARTLKPAAPGLPAWTAYDLVTRPTMAFARGTSVVNDPYGDERRVLAAAQTVK
jgi:carboxylesterase type B